MRNLSERQKVMLSYSCLGWNTTQIAEFLGISPYTVKSVMTTVLLKMESRSYKEAAEKALDLRIIDLDEIPKAVREYEFA